MAHSDLQGDNMKQSTLLKSAKAAKLDGILTGERIGRQETIDAIQIALHRHGWGVGRIVPFVKEVMAVLDYYEPAFCKNDEQDAYQVLLDKELIAIAKGKVDVWPFEKRYPEIKGIPIGKTLKHVTPIEYKERTE